MRPPTKRGFIARQFGDSGKVYSEDWTDHGPDRVQGLVEMRLPENDGELQQFLHAVNWMRTALPNLAQVEALSRSLLAKCLRYTSQTKIVATRRAIFITEWGKERLQAWENMRELVVQRVP